MSRCVALLTLSIFASLVNAESPEAVRSKQELSMDFVRVDAGQYTRGFTTDDNAEHRFNLTHSFSNRQMTRNERPSHRVEITQPFEIARTEVTVGQFRLFVEATGYQTEAEKNGGALGCFPEQKNYVDRFQKSAEVTWRSPGFEQTDQHPVVAVSWNDAQAFCRWLSDREGVQHRLPTEAEWEYACRAGSTTWYSWGEDPDRAYEHANVADGALEAAQPKTTSYQRAVRLGVDEGDSVVFTARVASYQPNASGLADMHGNVWEWCQDRWSADLYERYFDGVPRQERNQLVVTDPLMETKTDQHQYGDWRVIRGGAWTCAPAAVRCSIRTYAEAGDATVYTGFRVVRELRSAEATIGAQ